MVFAMEQSLFVVASTAVSEVLVKKRVLFRCRMPLFGVASTEEPDLVHFPMYNRVCSSEL